MSESRIVAASLIISVIAAGSSVTALVNTPPASVRAAAREPIPPLFDTVRITEPDPAMERKLAALEDKLRVLDSCVGHLLDRPAYESASIDPSTTQFSRVDTASGFLLVACDDVKPFLDRQKVTLRIGNPLGAQFIGFKIKLRWGARRPSRPTSQKSFAWWESLKEREYSFPQKLEAGRWNTVELVLPQTPADKAAHLNISIVTDTVSLQVPRK